MAAERYWPYLIQSAQHAARVQGQRWRVYGVYVHRTGRWAYVAAPAATPVSARFAELQRRSRETGVVPEMFRVGGDDA
jgi:hypothetical protein